MVRFNARFWPALCLPVLCLTALCGCVAKTSAPAVNVQPSPAASTQSPAHIASFDLATGRPVVQVMVNGQGPFPFVFDTGAQGLVVMKSLADELELDVIGKSMVKSPAGGEPIPTDLVEVSALDLAGARVEAVEAMVLDFGDAPGLGKGVVGPAVFEKYGRVAFDFASNEVEIGGAVKTCAACQWTPFGKSAPLLDIELEIADARIPAHIDSGAPHVITIPDAYAEKLPLKGPVQTVARARTVDREFEIKGAPIDVIAKAGGATIPLSQVQFFDLPFANIGSGALRGLYLEIDWRNDRFALSGEATPAAMQVRRVRVPADGS